MLAVLSALPVFGTTITVTNTTDSGSGSLRDAIASASSGDTINFSVTGTITLSSTLTISTSLTISGPGASNLAISGGGTVQVFVIQGGITVTISGVTIENGKGGNGGGINNSGTLTVANSTLSGNSSTVGLGGAIDSSGTLTVTNSTISGNSSAYEGGGINSNGTLTVTNSTLSGNSAPYFGGGIYFYSGTLTVTNSTLSGNSATGLGGGIYNYIGTLTVTNSTLSGNSAPNSYGGGIYNQAGPLAVTNSTLSGNSATYGGGGIFGTMTAKNTIVANSPSGGNCSGTVTSDGHNLSDDGSCFSGVSDIIVLPGAAGLDPSGLQNNGGPTQTIALLPASPAVDAIPIGPINYCTATDGVTPISTDQRGVARPQGPACDIGAFELVEYVAQVQQPINPNGSSIFNVKRGVVPIKFTLTLGGVTTCQLPPATISLIRTAGAVTGSIDESTYLLASDSGSNFRIDTSNCQYIYNLATSSLGAGKYVVSISIGGNVVGSGAFGLQ
jgi:hypothetical protein